MENQTGPNYELLKDAYAIIDGIPEKHFNLNRWVQNELYRPGEVCNTIACAGGWLAQHPKFNELGLRMSWERGNGRGNNSLSLFHQKTKEREFDALASLFNISYTTAHKLFTAFHNSPYDHAQVRHKAMFLNRVRQFLKQEGQL